RQLITVATSAAIVSRLLFWLSAMTLSPAMKATAARTASAAIDAKWEGRVPERQEGLLSDKPNCRSARQDSLTWGTLAERSKLVNTKTSLSTRNLAGGSKGLSDDRFLPDARKTVKPDAQQTARYKSSTVHTSGI